MTAMRELGSRYWIQVFREGEKPGEGLLFKVPCGRMKDGAIQIFDLLDKHLPSDFELRLDHEQVDCHVDFPKARANTKIPGQ